MTTKTKKLPHGYSILKRWSNWDVVLDRPGGGLIDVGTNADTIREAKDLAIGHYERRHGSGAWELNQFPRRVEQVTKHLPEGWELVNGGGYFYFAGGTPFETHSVLVPRLGEMTVRQWLADFAIAREMD